MLAVALFWIGVVIGIAVVWMGLALLEEDDREGLDFVAFGGCLISVCMIVHFAR